MIDTAAAGEADGLVAPGGMTLAIDAVEGNNPVNQASLWNQLDWASDRFETKRR